MEIVVAGENVPKLHDIRVRDDGLDGPASELARVVLHLGGDNGTTGRDELGAPVKCTTAALGLVVELVEGLDGDVLVLAADGVLGDGIELGTDNQVERLLVGDGEIEAAVLVGLAGRGVGLLGSVVEGVLVGHVGAVRVVLDHSLVREVVVDVGSLLGERGWLVDGVLVALGGVHRGVGGVLVNGDHVQGGVVTLVQEDLVALPHDHDVPGVHGAGGAHKHREHAVGGEDGGLVPLGEFLDDGVGGGGDVVGGAVDNVELALVALRRGLVKRAIVAVHETVAVDIFTLIGVEVQLRKTVEVNLLKQFPVRLDVNRRIAVALRLIVVLPAKSAAATGTTTASASIVATVSTLCTSTSVADSLELASTASCVPAPATLSTATAESTTSSKSGLGGIASVADDGEAGLVLGELNSEKRRGSGTVNLLV